MDWNWFWKEVFRMVVELATMWTFWAATYVTYKEKLYGPSYGLLVAAIWTTVVVANRRATD